MKQILSIIVILATFKTSAQTGLYHSMPDSGAKWCITYVWGMCGAHDEYTLYMNGNITAGSKQYHALYASGYTYCNSAPSYYYNQYKGAFREDTAARKVYMLDPGTSTDYLVYDFSLPVGGVCTTGNSTTFGPSYTITAIDSILVGGNYRKRLWTNYAFSGATTGNGDQYISLIEGIGSTDGLLCEFLHQGVEEGSVVNGFMENNVIDYSKNTGPCNFAAAIKEPTRQTFTISPNPTNGQFTISAGENIKDVYVLNSLGEIVFSRTGAHDQKTRIDLSLLENGIYFVQVKAAMGTAIEKVILHK